MRSPVDLTVYGEIVMVDIPVCPGIVVVTVTLTIF
jgi:hypothetical protein